MIDVDRTNVSCRTTEFRLRLSQKLGGSFWYSCQYAYHLLSNMHLHLASGPYVTKMSNNISVDAPSLYHRALLIRHGSEMVVFCRRYHIQGIIQKTTTSKSENEKHVDFDEKSTLLVLSCSRYCVSQMTGYEFDFHDDGVQAVVMFELQLIV